MEFPKVYPTDATVSDRLKLFIRESAAIGIPWDHIWPVATVSVNESRAVFRRERVQAGGVLPFDCFPARQVLALERGNPNLNTTSLPDAWLNDDEVMAKMLERGYWTGGRQVTRDFGRADLPTAPNDDLAFMFEWLMDRRKVEALAAFSVGATQNFLLFSPATGGDNSKLATLYPTLNDLWKFYTATNARALWDSGAWVRLGQAPHLNSGLTQCGNASSSNCIEKWLQDHQTSRLPWDEEPWIGYAARVIRNRDLALSLRKQIEREDNIAIA